MIIPSRLLRSVPSMIRLSCVLAIVALAMMVLAIIVPEPLPVIFAMSIGHALGGAAFVLYVVAVLLDLRRSEGVGDAASSRETR